MSDWMEQVSGCYAHRVTFSEVDALGFAHHSHAAVWCEIARETYFRKFGVHFKAFAERGSFLAMRELRLKYEEFIGYDDVVEVRTVMTKLGRVNLDMEYRIDNRTTGKRAISGWSNVVLVERSPDARAGDRPRLSRIQPELLADFRPRVTERERFLDAVLPAPALGT